MLSLGPNPSFSSGSDNDELRSVVFLVVAMRVRNFLGKIKNEKEENLNLLEETYWMITGIEMTMTNLLLFVG